MLSLCINCYLSQKSEWATWDGSRACRQREDGRMWRRGGGWMKDGRWCRGRQGWGMRGGGCEHRRGAWGGWRREERWESRWLEQFSILLAMWWTIEQHSWPVAFVICVLGRHAEQGLLHVVPKGPVLRKPAVHFSLGQPGLLGQLV